MMTMSAIITTHNLQITIGGHHVHEEQRHERRQRRRHTSGITNSVTRSCACSAGHATSLPSLPPPKPSA